MAILYFKHSEISTYDSSLKYNGYEGELINISRTFRNF